MNKLLTWTALLCSLLSFNSFAREVADIDVPETLQVEGAPALVLNGAGVRSKFFMDLYVGGLYLPGKTKSEIEVKEADYAAIKLTIVSGLISSEKMEDAIREGFDDATHDNIGPIKNEIEQFIGLFQDEIKVGDEFLLLFSKKTGFQLTKMASYRPLLAMMLFA